MKISMKHMSTEALKKSYYLAYSCGNATLVAEIEEIFKERKVALPVHDKKVTFRKTK